MWDNAAEPVLSALGYYSEPPHGEAWPHVWWAPGGPFSLLPIHAAGYHSEALGQQGKRTVMDRVISSYTPTIRALRYAHQHARALAGDGNALIIAMPTTPGVPGRLPNVPAEAAVLTSRLPDPVLLVEPESPYDDQSVAAAQLPTRANVLAHLPGSMIAHFACHGATDPTNPSNSLLLLDP